MSFRKLCSMFAKGRLKVSTISDAEQSIKFGIFN